MGKIWRMYQRSHVQNRAYVNKSRHMNVRDVGQLSSPELPMKEFIFSKDIVIQDATLLQNKHLRHFFKKVSQHGNTYFN